MENKKNGFIPLEKIFLMKRAGFTLLELLTVVAIISLLAAMIFPNLGKVRVRARIAKVVAELKTIELALMEYYSDHGGFPTNDVPPTNPKKSGLYKLFEEDLLETALQDAFLDAPYAYYSCVDNAPTADSCIVFSVGSDGVDNSAADFLSALADAYPGIPTDPEQPPASDNIYLFVGANMARTDPLFGRESDIRYKK